MTSSSCQFTGCDLPGNNAVFDLVILEEDALVVLQPCRRYHRHL